jgi:Lipid A 3-O-deacylase (PagL)
MYRKILFSLFFIFINSILLAQDKKPSFNLGFHYGFGNEFKNADYTYSNHYYKLQLYYTINKPKFFEYQILIQPEINFASHQLLNLYFVQPSDPDYLEKRAKYTALKDIKEYVLNIGFIVRKPISKTTSVYVLGSIGPLITDTETERLSKGFAFSDVIALGFSLKLNKIAFDLRPNIRHVSNAGFQKSNAGFNTKNIEFGFSFPL